MNEWMNEVINKEIDKRGCQFYSSQLTKIMQINLGVLKIWPHFIATVYTCIR